ncbi:MAG TPA: HAD-IA family hydrolase [Burkholderiales bacterium]
MKYRLIVFDWDGTIIDSASTIAACMQDAARDLGVAVPPLERARHVIGLGLHDAMRIAVPEVPAQRYPEFVASYRKHFLARKDAMQLFDGMRSLLEELSGTHALAVATGKSRAGLDRDLDFHKLKPLFASSRCADETNPKPHPAMLIELMDELGVDSQASLMIGDTSHDLEMARAASVDALAVTYGAHPEDGLRACQPLHCVPDVAALQRWLKQNG